MWILNKGINARPRFALVETHRLRGVKNPKQKVVCYLGRHDNFEDAIKFWEIVLRDLKRVERKNPRWRQRQKEYPLLKKYVRRGGVAEILERLKKYRKAFARLRYHDKIKEIGKIKRNTVRNTVETSGSLKLKLQIEKVSKIINKIKRDGDDNNWNAEIKSGIKTILKDVVDFYRQL
jgi:type III secretory pathway component EscV